MRVPVFCISPECGLTRALCGVAWSGMRRPCVGVGLLCYPLLLLVVKIYDIFQSYTSFDRPTVPCYASLQDIYNVPFDTFLP